MNELVFSERQQALTTSLKVAEVFNKQHKHILESIEKIIKDYAEMASESESRNLGFRKMFKKTTYTTEDNFKKYPMYLINRDGFTLLAMGFTGKKALKFKLAYIQEFNIMEAAIRHWVDVRGSTRGGCNKLTAAIQDYIIPQVLAANPQAETQWIYAGYLRLLNKVIGIPAGIRDELTLTQLVVIDQMQDIAVAQIRSDARRGKNFREIYQNVKQVWEGYAQVALVVDRFKELRSA